MNSIYLTRFGFGANTSQIPFDGGVAHQDDLIYLFPYPSIVADLNSDDTQVAKHMVDLWTSFVIDGIPRLTSNISFEWRPLSSMLNHQIIVASFVSEILI